MAVYPFTFNSDSSLNIGKIKSKRGAMNMACKTKKSSAKKSTSSKKKSCKKKPC